MSKKEKRGQDDLKANHPLQAIVLADSFTRTFRPMSLERPKVLLPLAGSPMIEYTLEMLANAKVKEIIVVCCWHASQVADYLHSTRWGTSKNPTVRVISNPKANSAGQALRDLAETGMVQSDPFILMSGDVVSNVRLIPIIKAHMDLNDKNKVMTMLFRKTITGNPLRNFDDDLVIAMNAETKQLLLYQVEEGEEDEDNGNEMSIPIGDSDFYREHSRVEIRQDLLDCHIDICSPTVLDLIRDQFHEDLRADMVAKEVGNIQLDHHFYVHELTSSQDYAARVHCVRSYDQVSKDVIFRWLYPLTPDNNWSSPDGSCWYSRGFIYREAGVLVARSAKIGPGTLLGKETVLGEETIVSGSVLGQNVKVETRAKIEGSYIWDNVTIGAGAHIDRALICNDACIGPGAKIMRGAIISFGVVVEPNTVVLPFTRLTIAAPYLDDFGDDESEAGREAILQHHNSASENVREYLLEEEDSDPHEVPDWVSNALDKAVGISKVSKYMVMGCMGCEELDIARETRDWRTKNAQPVAAFDDTLPSAINSLTLGIFNKQDDARTKAYYDGLAIEVKGLRAARESCSFEEIVATLVTVLLSSNQVLSEYKTLSPDEIKKRLRDVVTLTAPLLKQFTREIFRRETDLQVAVIFAAEVFCLVGPTLAPEVLLDLLSAQYQLEKVLEEGGLDLERTLNESKSLHDYFVPFIVHLVSNEVVEVGALLRWQEERENLSSSTKSRFLDIFNVAKVRIQKVIESLQVASDDDDDDDEDDDDEEEDDDDNV